MLEGNDRSIDRSEGEKPGIEIQNIPFAGTVRVSKGFLLPFPRRGCILLNDA